MEKLPLTNAQNIFYRNNYRRLVRLLGIMVGINLILVIIFIYLITHIPRARNFAAYPDNKSAPLYVLDQPLMSQSAILEWANQAAITVYNLDYLNYPKQMKEIATYFSPKGWALFQNDFRGILSTTVDKKLRVSAVATGAPVIVQQGPLLGNYSWKVRMPILVSYESASETLYQNLLVDMVIMRVSTDITPKGIAIAQFFATERPAQGR